MKKISLLLMCSMLIACSSKTIDYSTVSTFDEDDNLRAVIEIPVGTNDKIEYRPEENKFEIDSLDGQPRVIQFLPYPVNYGFIPSTSVNAENDEDPLDVLVFSKPLKTGQMIGVKPIGILKMLDQGEQDDKVFCVPIESKYQIININDFNDLSQNHPEIRNMISQWFLSYDRASKIQIIGWFDEGKALSVINSLQL